MLLVPLWRTRRLVPGALSLHCLGLDDAALLVCAVRTACSCCSVFRDAQRPSWLRRVRCVCAGCLASCLCTACPKQAAWLSSIQSHSMFCVLPAPRSVIYPEALVHQAVAGGQHVYRTESARVGTLSPISTFQVRGWWCSINL